MTTARPTDTTTQVYRVYIKATAAGDLGRDHRARVDRALRLRRPRRTTTCGPAARSRSTPTRRCERLGRRAGAARGDHRRRGDRGGPAAQAGADVADADGPDDSPPRASPASPTRSQELDGGVCRLTVDPRPRRARPTRRVVGGGIEDRAAAAAAGPGSSATSSRCWRPARASSPAAELRERPGGRRQHLPIGGVQAVPPAALEHQHPALAQHLEMLGDAGRREAGQLDELARRRGPSRQARTSSLRTGCASARRTSSITPG